MKISKLFHWLYAILMLSPVSAVGITCLTHVFNKEVSEETETATINYMYQSEQALVNEPLKDNYIYEYPTINSNYSEVYCKYVQFYDITEDKIFQEYTQNYGFIVIDWDNDSLFIDNGLSTMSMDISDLLTQNYRIFFVYDRLAQIDNTGSGIAQNSANPLLEVNISYIPIESVTITTNPQEQTTNIFYDSCEQVKDSFIFDWCDTNNPVRDVVNYGSALFNVDNDNLVNYFLTYWLSISIIWLIFDVFMYVPLLVHRWIDKANLE